MPVRKTSNRVGQGLMLYTLVMYGGVFAVTFVKTFAGIFFMHMGYDVDVWGSDPENDAVGLIGGVLAGLFMLFLFARRDVSRKDVFGWREDLPFNRLLGIMCVLMCGQLVFALGAEGIERLLICGLATDYCVKATVLDALKSGFSVVVVQDGCRAVNVCPDDGEKAFAEMAAQGAAVCPLAKVEW